MFSAKQKGGILTQTESSFGIRIIKPILGRFERYIFSLLETNRTVDSFQNSVYLFKVMRINLHF